MALRDAYSATKALRHLDVIEGVREGRPVRPVHVQLILSDLCNQACHFCSYRDPTYSSSQLFRVRADGPGGLRRPGAEGFDFNPRRLMPWAKVAEILHDCQEMGVQGIQFTGGGEPTVHPDLRRALAMSRDLGLHTAVVTNGVLVKSRNLADELARCAWVRVSLDAGDAETYARTRSTSPADFGRALAAVRAIRAERDRQKTDCVIGVGFVVTPENWREVAAAATWAKECGADNFRISAQFSSGGASLFESFADEFNALIVEAVDLEDERFTVFNRFWERVGDLEDGRPSYERCGYQHFTTYIGADLNVYRCCVLAYNEAGHVGSVAFQRFRDLWMSQERAKAMAQFDARGCERCQFNCINDSLAMVCAADEPLHAEFV